MKNLALVFFLLVGCGSNRLLKDIPPVAVKEGFKTIGKATFEILDYDLNNDGDVDVQIWLFVRHLEISEDGTYKAIINSNPYRIDYLKMGLIVWRSEFDVEPDGEVDLVLEYDAAGTQTIIYQRN